jgi:chromate transporter
MTRLLQLLGVFSMLSLLAVGGGVAVLPEMKKVTVTQHDWLTADQFVDVYSLGQLAPGPNMMMVTVIGYRVAGVLGALVVTLAFFLPASALTLAVSRLWGHFAGSSWRQAVQRGLAPVSIGLMCSGVVAIAREATTDIATGAIAIVVLLVLLRVHINPVWLILASALFGGMALRG